MNPVCAGFAMIHLTCSMTKPLCLALGSTSKACHAIGWKRFLESSRRVASRGRRTVVFGAGERMIRSYLISWAAKVRKENLRLVFRSLTGRSDGVQHLDAVD